MYLYTFSFSSQYMDGFYQVLANTEWRARELTNSHALRQLEIVSAFFIDGNEQEKLIYSREIDNPAYEG